MKQPEAALTAYRKVCELSPRVYGAYLNFGNILRTLHRYEEAVTAFQKALEIESKSHEACNLLGLTLYSMKRYEDALVILNKAIALNPQSADSFYNLGVVLTELHRYEDAVSAYTQSIAINPNLASAYNNLGYLFFILKRYEDAIAHCQKALKQQPVYANAQYNLGNALCALQRYEEAVCAYREALRLRPNFSEAFGNLGVALKGLKRDEEAIEAYTKALHLKAENAPVLYNLGNVLRDLKRFEEAIAAYTKALTFNPKYTEVYYNLGLALQDLGRKEEAMEAYKKTLAFKADHPEAHNNLGNLYSFFKRYEEAVAAYAKAVESKPDYASARASKIDVQAHICDWEGLLHEARHLDTLGITGGAVPPFSLLSCEDHPARHRSRSELYYSEYLKREELAPLPRPRQKPERLRVGYFSTDFCDHVITRLMLGLLRAHDHTRFEITAYSYGPDAQDKIRAQVKETVDVFKDVRSLSDKEIAELARKDGIDIAVDLTGYTQGSRTSLFAYRAAPVQISYLGYPGTTGAPFMDYLVADPFIIPSEQRTHYTEKILYLPHCYLVSDNKRETSPETPTRAMVGLPEDSFVFCCFNNTYKITPVEFDIWMRLLQKIKKSVLWLVKTNPWAEQNLRKESEKRGIAGDRLIFTDKVPFGTYIRRYALADLFLDTFNYNSNATANDALWAGLPVLTKAGRGLIARACGSQLIALDMPELITTTSEEYEARAFEFATTPSKLKVLKNKLLRNKTSSSLFNTELFAKHIENGYEQAYLLWLKGKEPHDIAIQNTH